MLSLTSNHRSGSERATGQYLSKFIRSDENNANPQDLSCQQRPAKGICIRVIITALFVIMKNTEYFKCLLNRGTVHELRIFML